ncbi:MAG: beta-galactosidase, partial [Lentisphaeria bacterium]|nr:beta-galactosidase [Lentisphaeria bacterium]
ESGRASVAIWDFAETDDNAANIAYLKKNTSSSLTDLRSVAASDWSSPGTVVKILPEARRSLFKTARKFESTPYDTFTAEIATPHRRWAKPLDGGPVRVLVIAPTWSQRETIELAQRLDLDVTTFSVSKRDVLFEKRWLELYGSFELYGYKKRNAVSLLGDLEEKLKGDYDCIVIGDVKRDILPDYFIDKIAAKVRAGTGLVATGMGRTIATAILGENSQPTPFQAILPIEALPVLRDFGWQEPGEKGLLTRGETVGEGRVLQMNQPVLSNINLSLTPSVAHAYDYVPADYEYFQALVAKAVLWAAKREPVASIIDLTMESVQVQAMGAIPGTELVIHVQDGKGNTEFEHTKTITLTNGKVDVPLNLALRRGGEHFLDVTIKRANGAVIDWASIAFETTSPSSLGDIALKSTVLAPGVPLVGTIGLRNTQPGANLTLTVTDAYERVVAKQTISLAAGATSHVFSTPLPPSLCTMHRIEATLSDAEGKIDWAQAEFTIPNRDLDNFIFLMWSMALNNWTQSAVNQTLADMGVDSLDMPGLTGASAEGMDAACRNAAWTALRPIPYITRIASRQKTGLARKPCLTDPAHLDAWTAGLRERAKAAAPYGPIAYTLGDENFLVTAKLDVCQSPTCLIAFRTYLQKHYADLAALNAEWDTKFATWNDVMPTTFKEAKESGQHARWVDHRRYMDGVLTQAHILGRQVIRESDPGARVGFDGVFTLNSWHGYDFYQLCQACDLTQVYCLRWAQIEYLRSFRRPNALLGAWHNGIGNEDEISAKRIPWNLLFNGFNSSWYWMAYRTGPAALFPDLRPTPQMEWMAESHAEIKAGIGELLLGAERLGDGIAIHYSQASVHGGTLLERPLDQAHRGAILAIEDLGLQHDFVSYEQIEQGALKDYRVFVMPASCALSDKEIAAIKAFAQAGGLVIADVYPGIMDGHCKDLATAALDDVFGCTVNATVPTVDPDAPVVFHSNAFGKGRGVFMNRPLCDYQAARTDGKEQSIREALRQTLTQHGVRSAVDITDAKTRTRLSACETVRFRDGQAEYVAVVKDDDIADHAPVNAKIRFPVNRHVFDLRRKRYVGQT